MCERYFNFAHLCSSLPGLFLDCPYTGSYQALLEDLIGMGVYSSKKILIFPYFLGPLGPLEQSLSVTDFNENTNNPCLQTAVQHSNLQYYIVQYGTVW